MDSGTDTWIEPAKVYPAPDSPDRWIVEAPDPSPLPDVKTPPAFSYHGSAVLALRHAYEKYGRARFFSF